MKRSSKILLFFMIIIAVSWVCVNISESRSGSNRANNSSNMTNTVIPSGSGKNASSPSNTETLPNETETDPDAFRSRDWSLYMKMPSKEQTAAASGTARSPYIAIYPHYSGVSRVVECSVDIHADHQPTGTYLCPMNWWMDVSSLSSRYVSVYNDYTGTPGGYCGFQRLQDGSRVFIMTVWTTFCKDKNGNVTTYTPTVIYPENEGSANKDMSEGSFVHCIVPYDWRAGKDYRVLLQQSNSASGSVVLTSWACDLKKNAWTKLVSIDTGISDIYPASFGAFLECFTPQTAGEVRSMEIFNLRVHPADSDKWVAADKVTFLVNGSQSRMEYSGSCNFGTDGCSVWAITSGVNGLCTTPSDSVTYPLQAGETDIPYPH